MIGKLLCWLGLHDMCDTDKTGGGSLSAVCMRRDCVYVWQWDF